MVIKSAVVVERKIIRKIIILTETVTKQEEIEGCSRGFPISFFIPFYSEQDFSGDHCLLILRSRSFLIGT